MCGIAGFAGTNNFSRSIPDLEGLLDSIAHRGPDDAGVEYGMVRPGGAGECDSSRPGGESFSGGAHGSRPRPEGNMAPRNPGWTNGAAG